MGPSRTNKTKVKKVDNTKQIVTDFDVYDQNGDPQTAEWLYATFDGVEVLRATVDSEKVFRIVAVYVTEGPAAFIAEVRGEAGGPHQGQPVAFSYASLEDPDSSLLDISKYNIPQLWTTRSVPPQRTNNEGISGFGLGSTYGPVYSSFILSPTLPSDCITKTGMKGGTNHVGPLHTVWQIQPVATNEFLPWDEPEASADIIMEKVRWWTEEMARNRENNNPRRADKIQYALIDRERGLMYRLENLLKENKD